MLNEFLKQSGYLFCIAFFFVTPVFAIFGARWIAKQCPQTANRLLAGFVLFSVLIIFLFFEGISFSSAIANLVTACVLYVGYGLALVLIFLKVRNIFVRLCSGLLLLPLFAIPVTAPFGGAFIVALMLQDSLGSVIQQPVYIEPITAERTCNIIETSTLFVVGITAYLVEHPVPGINRNIYTEDVGGYRKSAERNYDGHTVCVALSQHFDNAASLPSPRTN